MSERGEVEVLLPVSRPLETRAEKADLLHAAFEEAFNLVKPTGGRVLGMVKIARARDPLTDELAYRVTFAVQAPEKYFV